MKTAVYVHAADENWLDAFVLAGLTQLETYLLRWAEFREWEAAHDTVEGHRLEAVLA